MEIAGSRCRIDGDLRGRVVVLLHGFGAPGDDLVALGPALRAAAGGALAGASFVFPEAPMDLGPAYQGGRAWWWVDLARRDPKQRAWEERVPEGIEAARARVMEVLDALEARGVPAGRTTLGGFSQGAMLTLDVALRRARPPAALVLMSGALIARREWTERMDTMRGVPVFQSHGDADDILPFASAVALREILEGAGARVTWQPFAGGHGIPEEVLMGAARFLVAT